MSPATNSRRAFLRARIAQLRRLARGESVHGIAPESIGSPERIRGAIRQLVRQCWRS